MLSWPNRITLFRILLIPLFVFLALQMIKTPGQQAYRYGAIVVFAVMAVSDAADGYLARVLKKETKLGRLLDPVADKTLMGTACVLLALPEWPEPRLPVWIPIVVISREVFIVLGFAVLFLITRSVVGKPSVIGKATTSVLMAMILATLLKFPHIMLEFLWWVILGFTILSGIDYFYMGVRILNETQEAADSDKETQNGEDQDQS